MAVRIKSGLGSAILGLRPSKYLIRIFLTIFGVLATLGNPLQDHRKEAATQNPVSEKPI